MLSFSHTSSQQDKKSVDGIELADCTADYLQNRPKKPTPEARIIRAVRQGKFRKIALYVYTNRNNKKGHLFLDLLLSDQLRFFWQYVLINQHDLKILKNKNPIAPWPGFHPLKQLLGLYFRQLSLNNPRINRQQELALDAFSEPWCFRTSEDVMNVYFCKLPSRWFFWAPYTLITDHICQAHNALKRFPFSGRYLLLA